MFSEVEVDKVVSAFESSVIVPSGVLIDNELTVSLLPIAEFREVKVSAGMETFSVFSKSASITIVSSSAALTKAVASFNSIDATVAVVLSAVGPVTRAVSPFHLA